MSGDPYGPRPSTAQRITDTIAANNKGQVKPPRPLTGTLLDPHYNVAKHVSPPPAMLIGHYYPDGFLGARIEQWRIPFTEVAREYDCVVRQLNSSGKPMVECANALYDHFKIAAYRGRRDA